MPPPLKFELPLDAYLVLKDRPVFKAAMRTALQVLFVNFIDNELQARCCKPEKKLQGWLAAGSVGRILAR